MEWFIIEDDIIAYKLVIHYYLFPLLQVPDCYKRHMLGLNQETRAHIEGILINFTVPFDFQ
jgi:hypothetical protein